MRWTGQGFFVRCVFRELPAGVRKQRGKGVIPCKQIVWNAKSNAGDTRWKQTVRQYGNPPLTGLVFIRTERRRIWLRGWHIVGKGSGNAESVWLFCMYAFVFQQNILREDGGFFFFPRYGFERRDHYEYTCYSINRSCVSVLRIHVLRPLAGK